MILAIKRNLMLIKCSQLWVLLLLLVSHECMRRLAKDPVSEHHEQNVAAAYRQRNRCLIVPFALRDLSVIVGA